MLNIKIVYARKIRAHTTLENSLLTRLPVYSKDTSLEKLNERDEEGKECVWHFHALLRHVILPAPPYVHQSISPLNLIPLGFHGGFITYV